MKLKFDTIIESALDSSEETPEHGSRMTDLANKIKEISEKIAIGEINNKSIATELTKIANDILKEYV